MLKKCAILGVIVVSLGGMALAWGHYRMQAQQPLVNRQGLPKGSLRSQDYVSKYSRWYQIGADEQTKLVLELDNERRAKTPQQLAEEQRDRLQADVDKLAAGEMVPSEIVTYLYGPDWQQEVTRYKEEMDQARSLQAGAVVSVLFGAGLFVLSVLAALIRGLVRTIRNARARKADDAKTPPAGQTRIRRSSRWPSPPPTSFGRSPTRPRTWNPASPSLKLSRSLENGPSGVRWPWNLWRTRRGRRNRYA